MSTNEYVKYLVETFIRHLEKPKSERKAVRRKKREQKEPLLSSLFGLIPFSLAMMVKRTRGGK
jgi:hypothetical protein